MIQVHPTVEQTKAVVAILGDVATAGEFLLSLGLTYYQACKALHAADAYFLPLPGPEPLGFYKPRKGSSQAGTI